MSMIHVFNAGTGTVEMWIYDDRLVYAIVDGTSWCSNSIPFSGDTKYLEEHGQAIANVAWDMYHDLVDRLKGCFPDALSNI